MAKCGTTITPLLNRIKASGARSTWWERRPARPPPPPNRPPKDVVTSTGMTLAAGCESAVRALVHIDQHYGLWCTGPRKDSAPYCDSSHSVNRQLSWTQWTLVFVTPLGVNVDGRSLLDHLT